MFTKEEVLVHIERYVFKEVSLHYKGKDLEERFKNLFMMSESFRTLRARLNSGDAETCDIGQLHEFEDTYGEYISEEILKQLNNIPSMTVTEYLDQIKKEVFDYVLGKTELKSDQVEKLYYESENYQLSVASAKKWADEDGVIRSDIFETLIAGACEGIVKDIVKR
ncbi:hypothetical protein [Enterococcus termitis]|uniref:Uncharacterized protein n=1 Tax=Enterococcus termitis TaxID=332950 RepID=A0A1E5GWV7_9ENTE|nr:hypothetical protein [Enterococcus termitis]OEG16790.1 hypothetical protein BCR25_04120 [Enterococcus termitis]OJG99499.1 hypothetical protein RV18_GL001567 [Enterococcus termitis]